MLARFVVALALLVVLGARSFADEPRPLPGLTLEESRKLSEGQAVVKKQPNVRETYLKYAEARKAHIAERRKFPNERTSEPTKAWRKAEKELEVVTRKALVAIDPALGPLFDKTNAAEKAAPRETNEGETVIDSDNSRNAAMDAIDDVPGLPRVLLIGDSISIGYTLPVRAKLKGKANVHRIPMNGGATEIGLEKIDEWLGDKPWNVIHFNFGLHDAKYMSATELRATREQYIANLRTLIARMQKTGAKLIFATTTPVPKGGVLSETRKFDDVAARNVLAIKLMRDSGIAIDDLCAVVERSPKSIARENDVHFAPEGYEILGTAVAKSIEEALGLK
jgi:acyl-CoA thioesterase-1